MRDPFDRGSKWLIGHHGVSLLRLGGVEGIRSWRALQAEVTHPRQLPDGLLEVYLVDQADPDLCLVEVTTYPDQRVREQLARDAAIVWLDRRVLPEVLSIVLQPRGNVEIGDAEELHSRGRWTSLRVSWKVVKLWTVPAVQLLAFNDVGLIPWVPLTQFAGPPETMLKECRTRIDTQAPTEERDNLLALTQVMTQLRYNDTSLLTLIGGRQAMIESPLIQELVAEACAKAEAQARTDTKRKDILRFLSVRFRSVPNDVASRLQSIQDESKLEALIDLAASCQSLEEFRSQLA